MTYNLFISHSWTYSDAYERLLSLLNDFPYFSYKNYSVPKDSPIHNANSDRELKDAIRNQIKHASCILILAGVYSSYSKWINIEIQLAKELGKPIIAVEPWSSNRTSLVVKNAADKIVGWNSSTIISSIRSLG